MDQHFGRCIPSYPPRTVVFNYLEGRAKAADIHKFIRFRTVVRHVDFDETTKQFHVTVEDLLTNELKKDLIFDHVIVATGHYSIPYTPEFEGLAQFPGRVLHSHDYRGADEFVDKNLLIVGGSYSAEDIALQCYKFGARSITISYRSFAMGFKWPEKIKEAPLLQRLEGNKAFFKDGTTVDQLDCVILCTGYRHEYPFMAESLRLHCTGNPYIPSDLYKGIFWITEPRLAYLGMQNQLYTLTMFDVQAALVRDVFLGYVNLPHGNDESKQREEIAEWQAREKNLSLDDHLGFGALQTDYMRDITQCCIQETVPKYDFERVTAAVVQFLQDKVNNILTYRDQSFVSLFPPYQSSPTCQIPWTENMDDSIEGYLACIKNA